MVINRIASFPQRGYNRSFMWTIAKWHCYGQKYFTLTGNRGLLLRKGFQTHFMLLSSYLTDNFLAKNTVGISSWLWVMWVKMTERKLNRQKVDIWESKSIWYCSSGQSHLMEVDSLHEMYSFFYCVGKPIQECECSRLGNEKFLMLVNYFHFELQFKVCSYHHVKHEASNTS